MHCLHTNEHCMPMRRLLLLGVVHTALWCACSRPLPFPMAQPLCVLSTDVQLKEDVERTWKARRVVERAVVPDNGKRHVMLHMLRKRQP